ncbi:unnamed protein product, partial [Laminaria digitata]
RGGGGRGGGNARMRLVSSPPSETRTRFGYTGRGATPDRAQLSTQNRWESRFSTVVPPAESTMSAASGALSTPSPMTNEVGALERERLAEAAASVLARDDAGAAEEKASDRLPARSSFPWVDQSSARRGGAVAASSVSGGRRGGRPQSSAATAATAAAAAAAASDTDDTEAEKENLRELMRALGGDESGNDAERAADQQEAGEEEGEQEQRGSAGFQDGAASTGGG